MLVGDKIKFVSETLEGVITKIIDDNSVEVKTKDGFEIPVLKEDIILISRDNKTDEFSFAHLPTLFNRIKELGEVAHNLAKGKFEKYALDVKANDEVGEVEKYLQEIAYNLEIQKRQQNALYAATRVLAEADNLSGAMPGILKAICEGLGWQWAAMWTNDREAGVLRCGKTWQDVSVDLTEFSEQTHKTTFAPGEGLIGKVWTDGTPSWIVDVQQYPNFVRLSSAKKVGLHAALCFPIHSSHGLLGVLEFLTTQSVDPDNSLLAMMNAIGSQIGQFIERKLAQELSAKKIAELEITQQNLEKDFTLRMEDSLRLKAQHAATKVLAEAPGLSEATPRLLKAICEGLNWQCAMMWEVNETQSALEFVDCWYVDEGDFSEFIHMSKNMSFARNQGLPGRVWGSGEPLWILDVVKDTNFPRAKTAEKGDLHGAFSFPIRLKNDVLGVMEFFSRKVQEPDDALLNMMSAIGSNIGQFIERKNAEAKAKAYLLEVEEQKQIIERDFANKMQSSLRLSAQHGATKVLSDAPSLSIATPQLLQAICEGLNWQCAMMWEVNETQSALEFVDCWNVNDGDFTEFITMSRHMTFPRLRGLPGRVWDSGEPLWILDVVKDTNFPRAAAAEKGDLHGAFSFPIKVEDHVLGVMEFFSRKVQEPDDALLEMMSAIGSNIGQFIERKNAEARAKIYLKEVETQKHQIEQRNEELNQQNEEIAAQRDQIEHQKELVVEKQKEVMDSINYAKRIQRSLLASDAMLDDYLKNYFVFFQPKDIVSGDFYWASPLSNNQFALVTADSTGHGVPGAIMSMLNISCLNESVSAHKLIAPAEILNHTRKKIIEHLSNDGSAEGGKDGMDCSLISFDFENNKVTYSAANNPVWIIRQKEILEFAPDKMPVGKHDRDNVSFSQHTIELQKDDVIYALTDGMPDQFGGPKGKKFMYKQLKELLIDISHLSMSEQKEALSNSLNSWKQDLEQVDDVCLIGVRI